MTCSYCSGTGRVLMSLDDVDSLETAPPPGVIPTVPCYKCVTYDERGYPQDSRDPRSVDYLKWRNIPLIFQYHNCARCRSGERACVQGNPNRCSWPHARND
jgi:hypothetical protein